MSDSDATGGSVQLPGTPVGDGSDLAGPLVSLLEQLKLNGPVGEPGSAGVIESTTLQITSEVNKLIKQVGGATVLVGAASGVWAAVKDDTALAVVLAGGVAVVLSAMILGLAKIVDGDIRGRAAATTEQLTARAAVATKFLELAVPDGDDEGGEAAPADGSQSVPAVTAEALAAKSLSEAVQLAIAAYGNAVELHTNDSWKAVRGLSWAGSGLRIDLVGDVVSISEVTDFRVKAS